MAACTPTAWDPAGLAARHPALAAIDAHRLGDAAPYPWLADGVLVLFLCRWETPSTLRVSLPRDASPAERESLEAALRAWEGAVSGLHWRVAEGEAADVHLRFAPPPEDPEAPIPRAGRAAADCALDAAAVAPDARVLPARLARAEVVLRREGRDALGRAVPLSPDELAGAALHELGHALGFQGHARVGRTAMVRSTEAVRRRGRAVRAGEPFADATLRALYAVPSGAVVERRAVDPAHTAPVDRMRRVARERGWTGPFLRVGDRAARIAWEDASGPTARLLLERSHEGTFVPFCLSPCPE